MLKQVSVFAQNEKGTLQRMTGLLAENGINILGSVTNDSPEYGIVRMVLSDPEKALELFEANGYLCNLKDVIGVELEDKPGMLNSLLEILARSNVNVDYIYLSFGRHSGMPILIFKTGDPLEVEELLAARGFKPVQAVV